MRLKELIMLQHILEREQEATKEYISIVKEKLKALERELDNSELSSDQSSDQRTNLEGMIECYRDQLKDRRDDLHTITTLLTTVNETEFTLS